MSNFVGWVSPAGYDAQVVRTSPYVPMSVTVAPDGTIWTAGTEDRIPRPQAAATLRDVLKPEAAVFRRFDGSGKMIGGFVPQSEIQVPISISPNSGVFGSAANRIFWYSSKEGSAIEISLEGVVTRFSGLSLTDGEREEGLAVTQDGNIFVNSIGRSSWSISKLDRVRGAWVQIHHEVFGAGPRRAVCLYGADGNALVGWSGISDLKFISITEPGKPPV